MLLETYHWKQNQPLSEDYLHHFSRVRELFEYDPWDDDSLRQRAAWLDRREGLKADRERLSAVLQEYNRKVGNAVEAVNAARLLGDEQTLAVVGGQQAGLFTGPLLVIYKAITLIQTAKRASAKLNRPVVPVFWIAGEDHDFDEVNHIYYLAADLSVQKIKLDHTSGVRTSISRLQIRPSDWEDALRQMDHALMDTEFKPGIMQTLRAIGEQSATLVDYFARVMAWLFGSHGLVLIDSDDPAVRRLESPMFSRLIEEHQLVNEALLEGKNKVEALGYVPQAAVRDDQANLFVFHNEERVLLQSVKDGFTDRKGDLFFSGRQLAELAQTSPERLSNNALTRPLMQEFLFPVLCTILGPGEIAYWGLTRAAFRAVGMKMPVIVPRLEFTLLEGTIQKHMRKYELSFDDVVNRYEEKKNGWLDSRDTMRLEDRFSEVKRQFRELYKPVLEAVAEINPGLRKLGETNMEKIIEQIGFLEARSKDAFQSQFEASIRQLERIRQSVAPMGKRQERVYNVFAYLNKYGNGWLEQLTLTDTETDGLHRIVSF